MAVRSPPVLISFVLRLRPDQLALGQLVGEVEDVESGRQQGLRSVMELLEFCCQTAQSYAIGSPDPDKGAVDDRS